MTEKEMELKIKSEKGNEITIKALQKEKKIELIAYCNNNLNFKIERFITEKDNQKCLQSAEIIDDKILYIAINDETAKKFKEFINQVREIEEDFKKHFVKIRLAECKYYDCSITEHIIECDCRISYEEFFEKVKEDLSHCYKEEEIEEIAKLKFEVLQKRRQEIEEEIKQEREKINNIRNKILNKECEVFRIIETEDDKVIVEAYIDNDIERQEFNKEEIVFDSNYILLSGDTYAYKDLLKQLKARFIKTKKNAWYIYIKKEQIEELKNKVKLYNYNEKRNEFYIDRIIYCFDCGREIKYSDAIVLFDSNGIREYFCKNCYQNYRGTSKYERSFA